MNSDSNLGKRWWSKQSINFDFRRLAFNAHHLERLNVNKQNQCHLITVKRNILLNVTSPFVLIIQIALSGCRLKIKDCTIISVNN
jgi:hypothetical protein